MATFPHALCSIRFGDHAEQEDSAYLRSEVERGVARQRRNQADTRVSVPCTLLFKSKADADVWRTWFGYEGGGWFDFTLPRTGSVVPARVVGGNIGTLKPRSPDWEWSERSITIEYIRPGFIQLPPGLHSVNPARVLSVQRNSTSTYVDDAGLLQTAAANVARYQGGQMLVEGEATNLLRQSGDLTNAIWWRNNVAAVASAGTGPDGVAGHSTRVYSGALGNDFIFQAPVAPSGTELVASFFVKNDDAIASRFMVRSSVTTAEITIIWSGSAISSMTGGTCGWSPLANGWHRVWCAYVSGEANQNVRFYPDSVSSGKAVYLWGGDVKPGSELSSHIPTTTAPATRAADIITVAA